MKECPDEGRLQSFFDGELPADMMEQTARHIASCASCTRAAREVENQNAIFLRALEPELSEAVPTEQLRARITAAIAGTNARRVLTESVGRDSWWQSFTELFRFTPRRATAFASILAALVVGSILVAIRSKDGRETSKPLDTQVASNAPKQNTPAPPDSDLTSQTAPPSKPVVSHVSRSNRPQSIQAVKLIPGEESYLRTIARLDVGLKGDQRSMSPTTRAEYERNLKLVDYAIAATRSKAKRSPHDPDAAEFMFAAYQSKIDLLSTMTDTARLTAY